MPSTRRGLRSAARESAAESVPDQSQSSANVGNVTEQMSNVNISEEELNESGEGEGGTSQRGTDQYGDMHRLVLQGVMAAGFLDVKGVKKLFKEACKHLNCKVPVEEHTSPMFIQKVVREINEKIKVFDMMIRSATCEVSGEKFYVFLVTVEKQVMKFQTFFTQSELAYFQKVMDSILWRHNDFALSMTEAVNISDDIEASDFSKTNAEEFIGRMIVMQYLTRLNDEEPEEGVEMTTSTTSSKITLGFRTIREFEPIFAELYQDCFVKCCLCDMLVLNGLKCAKCPAVVHRGCLDKYFKESKDTKLRICTQCQAPWRKKKMLVRTRDGVGRAQKFSSAASQSQVDAADPPVKRTRAAATAAAASTPVASTSAAAAAASGREVDMPVLEPMIAPTTRASQRKGKVVTTSEGRKVLTPRATKKNQMSPPIGDSASDSD